MSNREKYTAIVNIFDVLDNIPPDSIISRTIFQDKDLKAIVFGFAPGQELSEHTAGVPAMIQILSGECDIQLGDDHFSAKGGFWVRLQPHFPHSIHAKTQLIMLLLMETGVD